MKNAISPCPFCGRPAEIYMGRTTVVGGRVKSAEECETAIAQQKSRCIVLYSSYGSKQIGKKTYYYWRVEKQGFIPRCSSPKCLGRLQILFDTFSGAVDAWNIRHVT